MLNSNKGGAGTNAVSVSVHGASLAGDGGQRGRLRSCCCRAGEHLAAELVLCWALLSLLLELRLPNVPILLPWGKWKTCSCPELCTAQEERSGRQDGAENSPKPALKQCRQESPSGVSCWKCLTQGHHSSPLPCRGSFPPL